MQTKILIIEDDKELRENIFTLLSEEGYNVITAKSGEDGVNKVVQETVDLIICDIMMPGMNGYNVLAKLNELKITNDVPFIFLSAKIEKSDLRLGMELGADDYIFKPFKADNLLSSIQTRLKRFEAIKRSKEDETIEEVSKIYSIDDRIYVDEKNKATFIKVNEIRYISAANQYSVLHTTNTTEFLFRRSLNNWEIVLPEKNFLRIHRSTIINLDHVTNIEKTVYGKMRFRLHDILTPLDVSKRYISKIKSKSK